MRERTVAGLSVCALCLVIGVAPAGAQNDPDQPSSSDRREVEITPFVSMGSAFSSRIGAAIAFAWTSNLGIEAEVGYRQGEINAFSSSVSLLYDLPGVGRVVPYLAAGAGLAQFGSPFQTPAGIVSLQKTAMTVNAGGGLKVRVDDRWSLRTDARWSNALGRDGPEQWRVYNGVSLRR